MPDGTALDRLNVTEVTPEVAVAISGIVSRGDGDVTVFFRTAALLTGLPQEVLDELDVEDLHAVAEAIMRQIGTQAAAFRLPLSGLIPNLTRLQ